MRTRMNPAAKQRLAGVKSLLNPTRGVKPGQTMKSRPQVSQSQVYQDLEQEREENFDQVILDILKIKQQIYDMRRERESAEAFLPQITHPSDAPQLSANTVPSPKDVSLPRVNSKAELENKPLLSRNSGLGDRSRGGAKSTLQIKQKPLAYGQMYKPAKQKSKPSREYQEVVLKAKLNDDSGDEADPPQKGSEPPSVAYENIEKVSDPFRPKKELQRSFYQKDALSVNLAPPSVRTIDVGHQETVASTVAPTEHIPSSKSLLRKPSKQSIGIQSYQPREEARDGNSLILFQSSEFKPMQRTPNLKPNLSVKEKLNFRQQWQAEASKMKSFQKMPSIKFAQMENQSPFMLRLKETAQNDKPQQEVSPGRFSHEAYGEKVELEDREIFPKKAIEEIGASTIVQDQAASVSSIHDQLDKIKYMFMRDPIHQDAQKEIAEVHKFLDQREWTQHFDTFNKERRSTPIELGTNPPNPKYLERYKIKNEVIFMGGKESNFAKSPPKPKGRRRLFDYQILDQTAQSKGGYFESPYSSLHHLS